MPECIASKPSILYVLDFRSHNRDVYYTCLFLPILKDPLAHLFALEMSPHILAPHDTVRVDTLDDVFELVIIGIQGTDLFGAQSVLLCPMRPAVVFGQDFGKAGVEFAIWDCETVWPGHQHLEHCLT